MGAGRTWRAGGRDDHVEDADAARAEFKKKTPHAAEQQRPDVAQARQDWAREQSGLDLHHLVFLDETWAGTNMTPTRGRAPVGSRCIGYAPYGHWKTTTLVCALRCDGLAAPWVIDGPINGEIFRVWVQRVLVPTLKPGDIVVLDNLSAHKVAGIAEAIQAAGAQVRYLPPYSPDYNPIEQVFSKLKTLLRRAARRVIEELWVTIGDLLYLFAADECERFIRHAGYGKSA